MESENKTEEHLKKAQAERFGFEQMSDPDSENGLDPYFFKCRECGHIFNYDQFSFMINHQRRRHPESFELTLDELLAEYQRRLKAVLEKKGETFK